MLAGIKKDELWDTCSIHIKPFQDCMQCSEYDSEIFSLWDLLCSTSVDPTLSQNAGLYSFADRCLFFSLIFVETRRPINPGKGGNARIVQPRAQNQVDISAEEESSKREIIGLVYLASPSNLEDEMACECSVGVSILPSARGLGIASYAVRYMLDYAFSTLAFHRVGAHVLGPSLCYEPIISENGKGKVSANQAIESSTMASERALRFFVGLGFSQEGTRRRAVPGNLAASANGDKSWRDAHSLAMLDTEWHSSSVRADLRSKRPVDLTSDSGLSIITEKPTGRKFPKKTRWDEMLARHQKEQETLAFVEKGLKRSTSTETIKAGSAIDMSMAAPGSLAPESSANAGASTNGEIHTNPDASYINIKDDSRDSSMSEDEFTDAHSRPFFRSQAGTVPPIQRVKEYLQTMNTFNFAKVGPSAQLDASTIQSEVEAFIAEGAFSVAEHEGSGNNDIRLELEDLYEAAGIDEEELKRIQEARDFLQLDPPSLPRNNGATPFHTPVALTPILHSREPQLAEEDHEHEEDSEMSETESEASDIRTESSSGSDWERMSNSTSPPVSEASTGSSWTNASVSRAGSDRA